MKFTNKHLGEYPANIRSPENKSCWNLFTLPQYSVSLSHTHTPHRIITYDWACTPWDLNPSHSHDHFTHRIITHACGYRLWYLGWMSKTGDNCFPLLPLPMGGFPLILPMLIFVCLFIFWVPTICCAWRFSRVISTLYSIVSCQLDTSSSHQRGVNVN